MIFLNTTDTAFAQGKAKISQLQTNTIEELKENYKNGYRIMAAYIHRNSEGDIVLEDGITLEDLVNWLGQHPDVQILFRTRDLSHEILKEAYGQYPLIKNQGIGEINDPDHYREISFNGFKKIVLNTKTKEYTDIQIRQMAYEYPYFGVLLDKDRLSVDMIESMRAGRTLAYVEEESSGKFSKHILDKMADGFIVNANTVDLDIMPPTIEDPYIVAHAGGQIGRHTYTNSIDAMENSYNNGIRLMEMDFEWTTDGELAAVHSWDGFITKFFKVPAKKYSYLEYQNFQMVNGWKKSTLKKLDNWFKTHPDAYLVTDIKEDNIKGLKIIKDRYPEMAKKTIPQIYQMAEYEKAKDLGYEDIILTLYLMGNTDDEIVEFAQENKLFAVTMPELRAGTSLPQRLKDIGVYVYAHTINNLKQADNLENLGVSGFYSDMTWNDNLIILP